MLSEIFKKPKPILGKVQLLALPGAPGWNGEWDNLTIRAEQEATCLATGGVDGLIIENFHDQPYTQVRMDAAGAIAMAMLTRRLKQFTNLPVGISVLSNDPESALAIAVNAQADFIRLSVLSGALLTDTGIINSRFNELLHYKNRLKVNLPTLFVDVSTRHIAPIGPQYRNSENQYDMLLGQIKNLSAHAEKLVLILSERDIMLHELSALKTETSWPILIENDESAQETIHPYFEVADGLILEADIRKANMTPLGPVPTVDMVRVETLINRLRQVLPVNAMDPDIFLRR